MNPHFGGVPFISLFPLPIHPFLSIDGLRALPLKASGALYRPRPRGTAHGLFRVLGPIHADTLYSCQRLQERFRFTGRILQTNVLYQLWYQVVLIVSSR